MVIGLGAVAAAAWWWWQTVQGMVLLEIRETGNRVLTAWPQAPYRRRFQLEAAADGGPAVAGLRPFPGLLGARLLVLWEVENEDLLVHQRSFSIRRLPATVPIAGRLTWLGLVTGPQAQAGPALSSNTENLIDNTNRVLPGDLVIIGLSRDGRLDLSYGGRHLALEPGQAWGEARWRGTGGDVVINPGDDWARRIDEALASGDPVTRVTIVNHGVWHWNRVPK